MTSSSSSESSLVSFVTCNMNVGRWVVPVSVQVAKYGFTKEQQLIC